MNNTKSTSQKQLEANKRNAKKWGIKTSDWKLVSKMNAMKHWLTSQNIVNTEEKEIFDNTYSTLVDELQPSWFMEIMLLERIAFYYTKLQRAIHIDTQQITIQKIASQVKHLNADIPDEYELGAIEEINFATNEEAIEQKNEVTKKINLLQKQVREIEKSYMLTDAIDMLWKLQKYETTLENRLYKSIQTFYTIRDK